MAITVYELCGADKANLFSPHCWKTRLSLAHKGLDYMVVPTPFTEIPRIEDGATKTVPLIRDGDTVLAESYEIARYLDETYPQAPDLLGGASGESLTQFIINWSQTQLHPIVMRIALLDIHSQLDPFDQEYFRASREQRIGTTLENFMEEKAASPDELVKALIPLESMLANQSYIGGEGPLFADYVVFGPLQWLRMVSGDSMLPQNGKVAEWFSRLLDMYDGLGRNVPVNSSRAA